MLFHQRLFLCLCAASLLLSCKTNPPSSAASNDVLVFARPGDSVGLDPASHDDGESINVSTNLFETLVQFETGTTKIVPALATRWTISPDGLQYTFTLRENVKFHDGTTFDADAVLFSFQRQRSKDHPAYESGAPYNYWTAMGMSKLITKLEKLSPNQVRFHLNHASAPFIANLTMAFTSIVSPAAVVKHQRGFDQNPSGTGPYQLKSWKKDDAMVLEAFDGYWGKKPPIKRVVVRVIPDNQVRLLELKRGSVHIMEFPNPADLKSVEKSQDIQLLRQEGMNIGYMAFNLNKKPLDKLEVRQAIAMGINRERIIREIFEGFAQVATNPIPPMLLGYNPDIKKIKYNPEAAKALLKKAGVKNLKINLWAMPVARPYNPNARKMAEFIQADLKRIGVEAKIVSYDWGTYLDKIGKGEHDLVLIGWTGDNGDTDNFLFNLLSKDAAEQTPTQNYAFYKSAEMTNLLKKAQKITAPAARSRLYRQAIQIIMKDLPILPIAHSVVVVPMREEIEGYKIHPMGDRRFVEASFKE